MATLSTLVTRNRALFGSTLGLLTGHASRILGIRVRRRFVRDGGKRILLQLQNSRCTRAGLLIVFARRVRSALRTSIACTLRLPRGRRGYLIVRTRTRSGCVRGDLCTCSCSGGRGCVQYKARRFACLRHLHNFLPKERAARAVVQQLIARSGIGQPHDEVVHSERKLFPSRMRDRPSSKRQLCAQRRQGCFQHRLERVFVAARGTILQIQTCQTTLLHRS